MATRLEMYGGVQQSYHAPFPIVNAAIADMMSVLFAGENTQQRESAGITLYTMVTFPKTANLHVHISVMQVAEDITIVRVRPYLQQNQTLNQLLQDPSVQAALSAFYYMCQEIILQTMRYTYPSLTLEEIKGVTPPKPTPDKGLTMLVEWKDRYRREVTDTQFAEEEGVQEQSIRNARAKLATPKVPRGKVRKK